MEFQSTSAKEAKIAGLRSAIANGSSMFEQAKLMHALCATYGMTQSQLAKELSMSQSSIGNKIRLLQFSERERQLIQNYHLSERHARTLLRLTGIKREKLIETAGKMHLTVQQTEEIVEKYKTQNYSDLSLPPQEVSVITSDAFIRHLQLSCDRLRNAGYKVGLMIESEAGTTHISVVIQNY